MGKYRKPSFMIIGGVKCGSSSLYRYLNAHPLVLPCKSKEPNYFSFRPWYQIPFSLHRYKKMYPPSDFRGKWEVDWLDLGADEKMHASHFHKLIEDGKVYQTGEATATSVFAASPKVLRFLYPDLKLIMLMRDPIERYVSHYRMYERFKNEGRQGYDFLPLEEYIQEEIRLHRAGKKTRVLHQGIYAHYLDKWVKTYGKDRICLIRTKDLDQIDTAKVQMSRLCEFLGLPPHDFSDILQQKFNRAKKKPIPKDAEKLLKDFYAESLLNLRRDYQIDL